MKKVLFFILLCLFAFTACEQKTSYENERDYQIEEIKPEEEINYCEVIVEISPSTCYSIENFEITYEGGYGLYAGIYLVPQGTNFKVTWDAIYECNDKGERETHQETLEVTSAKALRVKIQEDKVRIVNF